MERLVKPQYWKIVWISVFCLSVMVLVLPRFPDRALSCPLWLITACEWLLTLSITLATQFPTIRQSILNVRIEPGCFSLGLVLILAAIAVIFSPIAELGENGIVSVGIGQLVIMNLGIFLSILTFEQIRHSDHDEAISQASHLQRVTSTRIKRTRTNTSSKQSIKDLSPQISVSSDLNNSGSQVADIPETKENSAAQPPILSPTVDSLDAKGAAASAKISTEIRRLQSLHPGKQPKDPNKPPSKTMSRLKALSASGIGGLPTQNTPVDLAAIAEQSKTNSGFEQKSIDDPSILPEPVSPAITPVSPISSNIGQDNNSLLFKNSVDQDMDNLFAKIAPNAAPDGVVQPTRPAAQDPRQTAAEIPAQTPAQALAEALARNPARSQSRTAAQAPLRTPAQTPVQTPVPSAEQTNQNIPDSSSTVFKNPVDKDMDNLFAKIAPNAAPDSVVHPAQTPTETPIQTPPPSTEQNDQIISDSSSTVFKNPVDKDMDNLFAKIAPNAAPDSVVRPAQIPTETPIQTPPPSAEQKDQIIPGSSSTVFKKSVDQDMDNLFSKMVPLHAQKEVKDAARSADNTAPQTANNQSAPPENISSRKEKPYSSRGITSN